MQKNRQTCEPRVLPGQPAASALPLTLPIRPHDFVTALNQRWMLAIPRIVIPKRLLENENLLGLELLDFIVRELTRGDDDMLDDTRHTGTKHPGARDRGVRNV